MICLRLNQNLSLSGLKGMILPEKLWTHKTGSFSHTTYTEDAFNSILGEDMRYFVNSRYKLYVSEALEAVRHYINTGDVKYFYQHGQGQ